MSVQILTGFQMNKSGPLQVISNGWYLTDYWCIFYDLHFHQGGEILVAALSLWKRHLAPIWALLSFCSTKHILKSKQKWHSTFACFCTSALQINLSTHPLLHTKVHSIQRGAFFILFLPLLNIVKNNLDMCCTHSATKVFQNTEQFDEDPIKSNQTDFM